MHLFSEDLSQLYFPKKAGEILREGKYFWNYSLLLPFCYSNVCVSWIHFDKTNINKNDSGSGGGKWKWYFCSNREGGTIPRRSHSDRFVCHPSQLKTIEGEWIADHLGKTSLRIYPYIVTSMLIKLGNQPRQRCINWCASVRHELNTGGIALTVFMYIEGAFRKGFSSAIWELRWRGGRPAG